MADLNENIIDSELGKHTERMLDMYFEEGKHGDIDAIRDSVVRVVDFVLGEKRDDGKGILEDTLISSVRPVAERKKKKEGFFEKITGFAKKAANFFSKEESPPEEPETPLPKYDDNELEEVAQTVQDILPAQYVIDFSHYHEKFKVLEDKPAGLEDVVKENDFRGPEAAFVFRDILDFKMKEDYDFAIRELKIKKGESPEKYTVFQIRLLANARCFARKRYELLNHSTPPEYIPISPDDFKRAYIGCYLDHIEPHDLELRQAALKHALKRASQEEDQGGASLADILDMPKMKKEFEFLKNDDLRNVLRSDATHEELSEIIRKGLLPRNKLPKFIAVMRSIILDRNLKLSKRDNFIPLILKLNKLHVLYSGLEDLRSMPSREELNDAPHKFLDLIAGKADKVIDDIEPHKEFTEEEKSTRKKHWKELAAEKIGSLRENPATMELIKTFGYVFYDAVGDHVRRKLFPTKKRRR